MSESLGILMVLSLFAADPQTEFEGRSFAPREGEELRYRVLAPRQVEPGQKYPLVLFFHGAGERGDDNEKQLIHGMAEVSSEEMRTRHPAFVVAPQCPAGVQWVDTPWTAERHTMPTEPTVPLRLSLELVEHFVRTQPVDADRIYVTGLSMGGFGAWDALQRQPQTFAAALIVCGGGDPAFADPLREVPIWAFHGDADSVVQVGRSRDMVAALRAAGGRPILTEYEGVGHNSWKETYANRAVWDWLFSQQRQEGTNAAF